MKDALMIFAKLPIAGKVKTRLASTLGEEIALRIYLHLLNHTKSITKNISADKYLFYDSAEMGYDWNGYASEVQKGNNLGERMKNAYDNLFQKGYQKIVIIGSDCFELQEDHLQEAYLQLDSTDLCIGPAKDGGYYLLGLNAFFPQLFDDIAWSSDTVLEETLRICRTNNRTFHLLALLSDIDREDDLSPELKALIY